MTISYSEALAYLNRIRQEDKFPPIKRARWLENNRVQSHFFEILSFDPKVTRVHWQCRDCGFSQSVYPVQPPGTIYPVPVFTSWPRDSYLVPSEKGSVHWKRIKLPDCKNFLVGSILTR